MTDMRSWQRALCSSPRDFASMLACYQDAGFLSSHFFETVFRRLLAVSNMNADNFCSLGIAVSGNARHQEAANVFARALVLRPEDVDFYSNLGNALQERNLACLLYTSPSPRDRQKSRMPSSA